MSIITVPFSKLLLLLYEPVQNFGVALILFSLVVKLVLLPFQMKSKRSMMRMTGLSPLLKELEKKHGGNKQKYQEEVAKLYKEERINPMSGCIWTLIPFPILIALYSVVRQPLTHVMGLAEDQVALISSKLAEYGVQISTSGAYAELEMAKHIGDHYEELHALVPELLNLNYNFLGMNLCDFPQLTFFNQVDWSNMASWGPGLGLFLIPFVSAFLSWLTMKVTSSATAATAPEQAGMMKSMNIIMPLMSVYICFIMPAAMGVYWIAGSVFSILQELLLNRRFKRILEAEQAERNARYAARAAELERKREDTRRKREEGATEQNRNTSKKKLESQSRTKEELRRAAERAAQLEASGKKTEQPPSQVGTRRYARGRAYDPDRYGDLNETAVEDTAPATAVEGTAGEDTAPATAASGTEDTAAPDSAAPVDTDAATAADSAAADTDGGDEAKED